MSSLPAPLAGPTAPEYAAMPPPPSRRAPALARLVLCAALLGAAAARAQEEEKVLVVYNWTDYIADDTIAGFERETGIKVWYDTYETNEQLQARLAARQSGFDVVVPSSTWARGQAAAGLLRPLDKALLPNLRNLDPEFERTLARLDSGNDHLVPWLWGYVTLGINVDKVKAALGDLPMPENAWDLLFKKAYVSRLARCGVSVLDSSTEVIPAALHYLGRPAFSSRLGDYVDVPGLLAGIRRSVTLFSSSSYIDELARGNLCLALGYSGDLHMARVRAQEGRTGQRIETLLPRTGGILFMDAMAIPIDAPHPRNAHLFINYILRPEVHAALTNKTFYASANRPAQRLVAPSISGDRTVYLPPQELRRMAQPAPLDADTRRVMARLFAQFKTGM